MLLLRPFTRDGASLITVRDESFVAAIPFFPEPGPTLAIQPSDFRIPPNTKEAYEKYSNLSSLAGELNQKQDADGYHYHFEQFVKPTSAQEWDDLLAELVQYEILLIIHSLQEGVGWSVEIRGGTTTYNTKAGVPPPNAEKLSFTSLMNGIGSNRFGKLPVEHLMWMEHRSLQAPRGSSVFFSREINNASHKSSIYVVSIIRPQELLLKVQIRSEFSLTDGHPADFVGAPLGTKTRLYGIAFTLMMSKDLRDKFGFQYERWADALIVGLRRQLEESQIQ